MTFPDGRVGQADQKEADAAGTVDFDGDGGGVDTLYGGTECLTSMVCFLYCMFSGYLMSSFSFALRASP